MQTQYQIRRLGILGQVIVFVFSALPFWLGIYWFLPNMVAAGYSIPVSLSVSVIGPLALLLVAAIIVGQKESTGFKGLLGRWQLRPMKWTDLFWALVAFGISVLCYLTLGNLSSAINTNYIGINPPAEFAYVHTGTAFFGIRLAGNWWAFLLHFGILVVNILGEELWFRGVLFPKQQQVFGKNAWWVHGLCYYLFHMFYPWDVLRLLPNALAYGWVMQKTNNTWTIIIAHFLFNGIGLVVTISGILK